MSLKIFYQKYYCSNYYDVSVNEYGVECGTSLGFWEIMDELILQIFMDGFSGILEICQVEDLQMMKDKLTDGKEF